MATKQPVYCKKTSSTVLRRNHNGPINVNRCSKTDNREENSNDCVYDNKHCGLITRTNNRKVSRSRNTAYKHNVSKLHVASNCTTNYNQTQRCDAPCKLVSAYKPKNGKLRRASCRNTVRKAQKGGALTADDIKNKLQDIKTAIGAYPGGSPINSEITQNAIKQIQNITNFKVDPRNELRNIDLNNNGLVELNDLLVLASFKLSDEDNSGGLSLDEAKVGLTAVMGKSSNLTKKEFNTADLSGDGSLSFPEYQLLYVFKSNSQTDDKQNTFLSKAGLKKAFEELGITHVTDKDINDADINNNDKIDFSEFLLLTVFKWADMDVDNTKQDNTLNMNEMIMAFRLLGLELKPEEFAKADSDGNGSLDFSEFSAFAAYKMVTKNNKPMDRAKLDEALDYLGLGDLAGDVRPRNTEKRALLAKTQAEKQEEEEKAKKEKEENDLKKQQILEDNKSLISSKLEESKNERLSNAIKAHLEKLELCDGNTKKNDDDFEWTAPSEKQKCIDQRQIDSRLADLKECDANTLNPSDYTTYPYKQVCREVVVQGGSSIINLNQFVKLVKSIRNRKLQTGGYRQRNIRRMYF